jgi:hypothetical protein
MAANAYAMLHDPVTWSVGNAEEFRLTADWLDRIGGTLAQTVAARSGQKLETVAEWMTSAETWFDATQAKEAKLIDDIAPAMTVEAKYSTNRFTALPAALRRPAPPNNKSTLMNKFAQLLGLSTAPPPAPAAAPAPAAPPPAPPAISPREAFMLATLDAFGISAEALATAQADNKPDFAYTFVRDKIAATDARAAKVDAAFSAAGLGITTKELAEGTKDLKAVFEQAVARETARMTAAAGGPPAGRETGDTADDTVADLATIRNQIESETNPEKRACLARRARKLRTGRDQII